MCSAGRLPPDFLPRGLGLPGKERQSMLSFRDRKIAGLEAGANGPAPVHGCEPVIPAQCPRSATSLSAA